MSGVNVSKRETDLVSRLKLDKNKAYSKTMRLDILPSDDDVPGSGASQILRRHEINADDLTLTPTITNTPSVTDTPSIPESVATRFESIVTPQPNLVFSYLTFATDIDKNFQPIDPAKEFANPLEKIYACFSYNNMTDGVQWTEFEILVPRGG